MGFESSNPILNLGLVFLFTVVFLVVVLIQLGLSLLAKIRCRFQDKVKSAADRLHKKLYWNFFIRLFIETYIDQAFVQALKLRTAKFRPWTEAASTAIAATIIFIMLVYPIGNWIFVLKNKARLNDEHFKERYEAAYENVRTTSPVALGYTSIFMYKRLIFAAIIMVLETQNVL